MNSLDITNIGTWYKDNEDVIYRYWVYKKVYTPYEQDKKFSDESVFEDKECIYAKIINIIEIPNDVLIEFLICYKDIVNNVESFVFTDIYSYQRLSNICLLKSDIDQELSLVYDIERC